MASIAYIVCGVLIGWIAEVIYARCDVSTDYVLSRHF